MSLALLSGALNALFMTPRSDWYHSLKMPSVSPAFHSAAWLICYIAFAVVFAEFLSEKELRKYLWVTVPFPVGNALWCAVFFRLHNAVAALVILCALCLAMVFLTVITVRKTKIACFAAIFPLSHYIFLTGLNIMIVIFNT